MKLLIILVILAFSSSSLAAPNIAGAEFLGHGFDAYKGLYGLAPVFSFSYDDGNTWTGPSGNSYAYPDQMFISTHEEVYETTFEGAYQSYSEYLEMFREWFYFDVTLKISSFNAGFEYNKQLGFVHETMTNYSALVMHGYHYWNYYHGTMYPSDILKLDQMFYASLELFPASINTQQDYNTAIQFVDSFGTHYLDNALFGATVNFDSGLTQNLVQSYSYSWCVSQFTLAFHFSLFNISSGGYSNKSDIQINQQFLENSDANVTFVGGNPIYANISNITQWVNSIESNGFPLNSTLVGLWELVTNQTIQQSMMKFILDYTTFGPNFTEYQNRNIAKKQPNAVLKQTSPIECLGTGIDVTTFGGCLLPVYLPQNDSIFTINIPESQMISINITMTDYFDINAWSETVTSSSYGFLGMGTKTTTVKSFYNEFYENSKSLVMNFLQIAYQMVTAPILPAPQLNPMFVKALNALPRVYNNISQDAYFQVLQSFGMGVIDEIILGGYFEFDILYDAQLISEWSEQEITEEASWSFLNLIGGGNGHSSDQYQVDKAFSSTMQMEYTYIGGGLNYTFNQWAMWLKTVKNNTAILQYHLQPITLFIADPQIRNNFELALIDYGNLAQEDLNNYIKSLQKN